MPDTKHKFDERTELALCSLILDREVLVAQQNQQQAKDEFEAYVDLFDAERAEKEYEWMSDIFIPEFPTQVLMQTGMAVNTYFAQRDFVEVYAQDASTQALAAADAAKECVNRTLNRRNLYHFLKFCRSDAIKNLQGNVVFHSRWIRETEQVPMFDENGSEVVDARDGKPAMAERVTRDEFDYEVLDPRNVFTSNEYAYSMQEKRWVVIRYERTLEQLREEAVAGGFFNLDLLEKTKPAGETETSRDTQEKNDPATPFDDMVSDAYDIFLRYGKFWAIEGKDGKVTPGIDEFGKKKDNAVLIPMRITVARSAGTSVLIGFDRNPYRAAEGQSYIPVIRGLCYVHPTRDRGVGDGKYCRELQVAINDTFNMGNDRTSLATTPTIKVKKYSLEDTDSIFFAPGHPMALESPDDVQEFKISDNIQGSLLQGQMLKQAMSQATSVFPTTLGDVGAASTTATAIAGADQRTSQRSGYKAMTFEYTGLWELYWMILQMTYQFASPETGKKLMGDKVMDFDPAHEFFYKPVSAAIETEYSRGFKMRTWKELLQIYVQLQHPDAIKMVNAITRRIAELMGDEQSNLLEMQMNQSIPITPQNQGTPPGQAGGGGASNQNGIAQSRREVMVREAGNAGMA